MELRQLAYFVAITEERNFTRAAERIPIAQPAISQQIRRLEAELGEQLFLRDRRGITLTPAGQACCPTRGRRFRPPRAGARPWRRSAACSPAA
jgi:DNA-binding transcriptional LysR family regulator